MAKVKLNDGLRRLREDYVFYEVAAKIAAFEETHPGRRVIRLGIGDVTLPLGQSVVSAMRVAVDEMSRRSGFRGYAPEGGYDFLRRAVSDAYAARGVAVAPEEVFVSDGSKSDQGNVLELFGDAPAYLPDPVYPAYRDANLIAGREVRPLYAGRENGFLPAPDQCAAEPALIYVCSPNNPTGAACDRAALTAWVEHALRTGSVILFDAAYEAFASPGVPRSVFEIPGARECAIEFYSLSKSAGFTGTRCAWTVIPRELECAGTSLGALWRRRRAAKFNGVAYVVQRGAEAALSPRGREECRERVAYYKENRALLARVLAEKGVYVAPGEDSPYLWFEIPGRGDSREYFDSLLSRYGVAGTPGAGFGKNGEGYFRLSAFASREDVLEAARRIREGR